MVYAGKGSSHSWTWLADLFDSREVAEASFVDADGLKEGLQERPSLVVVSGGDGFEIASSLSPRCFKLIEERVRAGMTYVGVCAGAYLPLPSSLPPFNGFNLSSTRIKNIYDVGAASPDPSPRVAVRYGSCSIIHPVRGPVVLTDGESSFEAPLYGGPVFREPASDSVLLRYSSFTAGTTFQAETESASEMMIGAPAVVSCRVGRGAMVLAGPHLEHPGYAGANDAFMELAGLAGERGTCPAGLSARPPDRALERSLADLKVAALGLERESFLVGSKLWDGGRILELVGAIEKRKTSLDGDVSNHVRSLLGRAREEVLSLGVRGVSEPDSAPALVVEAARVCVDCHFRARRG